MGQTELRTRLLSTTSTRQMKLSARCSSGGAVTDHHTCPPPRMSRTCHRRWLAKSVLLGETSAAAAACRLSEPCIWPVDVVERRRRPPRIIHTETANGTYTMQCSESLEIFYFFHFIIFARTPCEWKVCISCIKILYTIPHKWRLDTPKSKFTTFGQTFLSPKNYMHTDVQIQNKIKALENLNIAL